MPYQLTFDAEKSIAATARFVTGTGESMYFILKMFYVADRLHLERYGRPITGDKYAAMAEGPTPSKIYDLMKFLRGERKFSEYPEAKNFLSVDPDTHAITILEMPEQDVLSASDAECLDAVIAMCKEKGRNWIVRSSHDKAWEATSRNSLMDIMTIAGTLKDGPVLSQHLAERFSD